MRRDSATVAPAEQKAVQAREQTQSLLAQLKEERADSLGPLCGIFEALGPSLPRHRQRQDTEETLGKKLSAAVLTCKSYTAHPKSAKASV